MIDTSGVKPVGSVVGPAPGTPANPRHYPARDMRWLEVRGRTFYAVMEVPRPLRARLGKKRLVKRLGTRDYHIAKARRHGALAEFQRVFDRCRHVSGVEALTEAALSWRDT